MKKILLLCFCSATFLVGCQEAKEVYTVDYLFNNKDKLDEVLEDCKLNKQVEENCTNAKLAAAKMFNSTGGKKRHEWK